MLIVFVLLLLGVMVGAVAHLPVPASLAAGALIVVWLTAFIICERRAGQRF
ncbi:hypothetical protein ABZ471_40785 [Streptomyces sp. NPDC005728]|uniref:hypothetical protein n=1 Tax=Streptomyces sp. NPDC005728 TaxID=3157054 RepID=UPI0033E8D60A